MAVPRIAFSSKQKVAIEGRVYRYEARGPKGAVFRDLDSGEQVVFTHDQLAALYGTIVTVRSPANDDTEEDDRRIEALHLLQTNPRTAAVAHWRMKFVRAWLATGEKHTARPFLRRVIQQEQDRIEAEIAARNADVVAGEMSETAPKPPAPGTLQEWIRAFKEAGYHISGLVPRYDLRGNRNSIYTEEEKTLYLDALEDMYLQVGEPPMTGVYWDVIDRVSQHNKRKAPSAPAHRVPSKRHLYRLRDRHIDKYTLVATRRSKEEADNRYQPVGSGPVFDRINMWWELDSTELTEWIIEDKESGLIIGHPYLTSLLDRYSTAPVALYVGWEAGGLLPAIEATRNALLPKTYVQQQWPEIEQPWPCFGRPLGGITPDNDSGFRSDDFVRSLGMLFTDVDYSPVATPRYKGRLERWFLTMQKQFRSVPGRYFRDYYAKRRAKEPERVSVVTMDEINMLIHKFVCDVYLVSPRKRFNGRCAREIWEDSARIHGIFPPPSREELDAALSLTQFRVPHKDGIIFEGLRYNNEKLANIVIAPQAPKKFLIKIDPANLGTIKVEDFEAKRFIDVPVVDAQKPFAVGMTLRNHRLARAMLRNNPSRFTSDEDLARAHLFIARYTRDNQGKGTQTQRRRLARHTFTTKHRDIQADAIDQTSADLKPIGEVLLEGRGVAPTTLLPTALPPERQGIPVPAEPTATPTSETDTSPEAPAVDRPDSNRLDLEAARHRLGIPRSSTASGRTDDDQ